MGGCAIELVASPVHKALDAFELSRVRADGGPAAYLFTGQPRGQNKLTLLRR